MQIGMDYFAVLYCPSQDAYSIKTVEEMIQHNIDTFYGNLPDPSMTLGITATREEADTLLSLLKQHKHNPRFGR